MPNPNAEVVKAAIGARDEQTFMSLHAEDVVLHVAGRGRLAGTYVGHAELSEYFAKMTASLDATPREEDHAVMADDDHVVRLYTSRYRRGGEVFASPEIMVFHVRDGTIREVWLNPTDQYAYDAYWA